MIEMVLSFGFHSLSVAGSHHMRTGIISKLGVERTGFQTLAVRGISTLFKWRDLEILNSVLNVESKFFVIVFQRLLLAGIIAYYCL